MDGVFSVEAEYLSSTTSHYFVKFPLNGEDFHIFIPINNIRGYFRSEVSGKECYIFPNMQKYEDYLQYLTEREYLKEKIVSRIDSDELSLKSIEAILKYMPTNNPEIESSWKEGKPVTGGKRTWVKGGVKVLFDYAINDCDYQVTEKVTSKDNKGETITISCPYYSTWLSMINRALNPDYKKKFPTYKDCTLDESFRKFSDFLSWAKDKYAPGLNLDKDLLVEGNKKYGSETCVFIPRKINNSISLSPSKNSDNVLGVTYVKLKKKPSYYQAFCSNENGSRKLLGKYKTEIEAHQEYLRAKKDVFISYRIPYIDRDDENSVKVLMGLDRVILKIDKALNENIILNSF